VVQLFATLLIAGLLLVGIEVFAPGAVIGTLGALALVGAAVAGFLAFGPVTGGYVALGILILVGIVLALWVRFFPASGIGKKMTVSQDLSRSTAVAGDMASLLGKQGVAISELRPAGFAQIEGRRVDVVTQGEMIAKGQTVKVVHVAGSRVVVAGVRTAAGTGEAA
jgi:membrane-bound serine protease (ClpP class)